MHPGSEATYAARREQPMSLVTEAAGLENQVVIRMPISGGAAVGRVVSA
jgi:hypothetical protein